MFVLCVQEHSLSKLMDVECNNQLWDAYRTEYAEKIYITPSLIHKLNDFMCRARAYK